MGSSTQATANGDNNKNRDDLTQIRGIGVSRKQWLNSLGIYTIADLAQASADEIESQLKHQGRLLSRSELEEWIAQAKATEHQTQQDRSPSNLPSNSLPSLPSNSASDSPPDLLPSSSSSSNLLTDIEHAGTATEWHPIAVFKVEYQARQIEGQLERQTLIHHLENNAIECWSGFETALIQPWIQARIEATTPQLKTDSIVPEIIQLRVIQSHSIKQPMLVDKTHPTFSNTLATKKPFDLEVSIQLTGLQNTASAERIPCKVHCTVHDVLTGATTTLGEAVESISLTNNSLENVLLPKLILLTPGIYRLKVFASLQNQPSHSSKAVGYFKVPMLQVV